jgi:hypothetical protein
MLRRDHIAASLVAPQRAATAVFSASLLCAVVEVLSAARNLLDMAQAECTSEDCARAQNFSIQGAESALHDQRRVSGRPAATTTRP